MIRENLHITIESPFWEQALEKAMKDPTLPQWLTEAYLDDIEKDFSLLGDNAPFVYQALCQVVKTPELCLLAKTLYHIIDMKTGFSEAFSAFSLPKAPEGLSDTLGYDYVGLFPILAHVRPSSQALAERGVALDIIYDTLSFLRNNIKYSSERAGKPCFDEDAFSVFRVYVYTKFLWIGRLRFEIGPKGNRRARAFSHKDGRICLLMCDTTLHASGNILGAAGCMNEDGAYDADFRETDEYYEGYAVNAQTGLAENTRTRLPKKEWKCILQPGDALLKVHVPYTGKLSPEACDASYKRARQVFAQCYPEYTFKGFVCISWLLCPLLATFLKKDSNIVRFQESFRVFPVKSPAKDVFQYVYKRKVDSVDEVNFAELPEDNTMQRGVKKLLLEGRHIHQFDGFIPF